MKIYTAKSSKRLVFTGERGRFAAKMIDIVNGRYQIFKYVGSGNHAAYAVDPNCDKVAISSSMNAAELSHELSTVHAFSVSNIEYVANYFGFEVEKPESGMLVRIPDNMQKSRIANINRAFARVKSVVSDKGYGRVFDDGTIVFGVVKSRSHGTYSPNSNETRISSSIASNEDLLFSVITHEIGHKIEMSNRNLMALSNRVYSESDISIDLPKIGQTIDASEASGNLRSTLPYVVVDRDIRRGTIKVECKNRVVASGPISAFINKGFVFGSDYLPHTISDAKNYDTLGSGMFPTAYSRVDAREMFAECFSAHIIGCSNEVIEGFMRNVMQIYRGN